MKIHITHCPTSGSAQALVASSATALKAEFDVDPQYARGRRGQFRVEVDGRTVLERKGGIFQYLMRAPWPTDQEVVAAVRTA